MKKRKPEKAVPVTVEQQLRQKLTDDISVTVEEIKKGAASVFYEARQYARNHDDEVFVKELTTLLNKAEALVQTSMMKRMLQVRRVDVPSTLGRF